MFKTGINDKAEGIINEHLTNHFSLLICFNNKKRCKSKLIYTFWRRERDSNPRYLAVQRFSRPPQSTTLPSLQNSFARALLFKSDAKIQLIFESASHFQYFFQKIIHSVKTII